MENKGEFPSIQETPGGLIETYHNLMDQYGFLSEEAIIQAARASNISVAEAYGVATFYTMFALQPRAKNVIRICHSAPCHVAGAAEIVQTLEKALGIKVGESTGDGLFALEYTECVGQCHSAPVITINGQPHRDITPGEIPELLAAYSHNQDRPSREV